MRRTWEETKRILFNEDPVFIFARAGNVVGLKRTVNIVNLDGKDKKGYSPLMLAAHNGHVEAVSFLLSLDPDINSRDNHGNSPLMAATFNGHLAVVKLLLENGADPNASNLKRQTALLFARTFGHTAIERILTSSNFQSTHS